MVDIGVEWWILYGSIGVLAVMVGVASIGALNGIIEALMGQTEILDKTFGQLHDLNTNIRLSLTAFAQTADRLKPIGKIQEELDLLRKQLLETNKNTKQVSTAVTALALLFREATTQTERDLKELEAELEQEAHKNEVQLIQDNPEIL